MPTNVYAMDTNRERQMERDRADVLIVDDRPDKLLVYRTILEDLDQNLFTVASGEQALKQVLERDFAVILLDVNMPGMDGLETAALIRKRGRSAHIPIIFVTADFNDDHHMAKGYALGAVDYIASPVVPEILRAKVKVFVDLYLLAQQAQRQAQEHIALAEEKAARQTAEQATRRLAFLAQASVALAGSLDLAAIMRELVGLCVPFLADVCALALAAENGESATTEVAWMSEDPQLGLRRRSIPEVGNRWFDDAVARVQKSGKLETFGERSPQAATRGPGEALLARDIGAAAEFPVNGLAIVPLPARGRTLGVLALGLGPSGRNFDTDALSMATDLAGRAAIALDNAGLYGKIQAEDRRKDEFLAMLAHELRNPLAPISNAVHILQVSEKDPAKFKWATEVIGRQLTQLVRLVDDLLDVSRITRGKIELKIEAIDASKVVAAAVETSRPFVDALEHTLTVLLPPEPLLLKGDFARVAQILANLINNAAKYTNQGGRIAVTAAREGANVVFRVRDSGIGIPGELLSSIFEPFTQIDRTLARSQGGLGIGLTLVRRLVEMQDGRVFASSEGPDRGSEFTVSLPAATPAQRAKAESGESGRTAADHLDLCVLVVDDNHDVAESTAVLLRLAGCEVYLAHDGEEALRLLPRVRPDAILLDIGLPRMNGYEVAERIRSDPENRDILIVAVSGYGQQEHRLRSKQAGFDQHVVKPIDPTVLSGLLAAFSSERTGASSENVVSFRLRKTAE
ncbi:MAG TPA: response regulator [Casimicrobiaceae bacterium]|jgi:CheY-like chemotaxis protein|nr:response regulator [Casimicrobiaceae bacterium]